MSDNYIASNKASSTLAANINATAMSITVATGEGARFPAPTNGDYTLVTLQNTAGQREVVCIVGLSGDVLTVGVPGSTAANVAGRNYESIYGMTAASWVIGDVVSVRPTAGVMQAAAAAITTTKINAATSKATPVDADEIPILDSAASNGLKKLTWANLKATVYAALPTFISSATSKATPVDADMLPLYDSAATTTQTKLSWANVKATMKTYLDGVYLALVAPGTSGNLLTSNGAAWVSSPPAAAVLPAGSTLQQVEATPYTTNSNTTTRIPSDDTIPQNTEGTEYITVSITPTNASNRLRIEFDCPVCYINAADYAVAALFQDSTAGALAASIQYTATAVVQMRLVHEMAAGTTSATTFKIRMGPAGANTLYVNGTTARYFGGVSALRLRVTEIKV